MSPAAIGICCYLAIACTTSALAVAFWWPVGSRLGYYVFCFLATVAIGSLFLIAEAYRLA